MIEKLLKTTDEKELSQLAGNILRDGPFSHDEAGDIHLLTTTCSKCGLEMREFGIPAPYPTEHYNLSCIFALPIPITWDEAMKWFRQDVCLRDYQSAYWKRNALMDVYLYLHGLTCEADMNFWVNFHAEPQHYIKAACLSKLYKEERIEVTCSMTESWRTRRWLSPQQTDE